MYLQKVWTVSVMSPVFFNLLYKQSVFLYFTKNYILFSSYFVCFLAISFLISRAKLVHAEFMLYM